MIQIRNGMFETNSSSCHSICISKKPVDADGCNIDFHLGEYGWECAFRDAADYLYTAIMCSYEKEEREDRLNKLKDILDRHDIKYTFEKPVYKKLKYDDSVYEYLENGSIDHDYETHYFVDTVLDDEDMLLRLLFSDSYVITGNDNCGDTYNSWYVGNDAVYEKDEYGNWHTHHTGNGNENHPDCRPDEYDYFYKGN